MKVPTSWLWLSFVVIAALIGALYALGRARADGPHRRWAREAQRRVPLRPSLPGDAGELLDHLDRQIEVVLTERHRIRLLYEQGLRLRREVQRSAGLRAEEARVETALARLVDRMEALAGLAERLRSRREDVLLWARAREFDQAVDEATGAGVMAEGAAALDEQVERLLDISEAERELELLLRS